MNGTDATRWLVRIGVVVGGTFTLASGLFSALLPVSFYQAVATFSPYNQHLFHDVGVFQIGLGLTLLLTLVFTDALLAALVGNSLPAGPRRLSLISRAPRAGH